MKHAHILACVLADLAKCHLRLGRTLAAPLGLMLGATFNCLTGNHLGHGTLPGMLMLPGDLGPGGPGQDGLLLFWALTYAMLPVHVFGLYEMAIRGRLVQRLQPLTRRIGKRPRAVSAGISVVAALCVGCLLFGAAAREVTAQTPTGLVAFLVMNWLLLHLLMVIVTLSTAFFAGSRLGAPGAHHSHYVDSRHASG